MVNKQIGMRIKRCREKLGLTQEQFAERVGLTVNYVSMIERGVSFPRCDKLVAIMNELDTSADDVFCDVVERSSERWASELSQELSGLSPEGRRRILQVVELLVKQEREAER